MGLISRSAQFGKMVSAQSISQDATTATALTVPATAVSALVTAWGAVSYRLDGTTTAPTTTVGHVIPANGSIELFGDDMNTFKVISLSGTNVVFVTYFSE